MPVLTPHVGVRTFNQSVDPPNFIVADMSTIAGTFTPGTGIDRTKFPVDRPVCFTTDDTAMVTACGTGTLRQAVDAIIAEGVTATVIASVPDILANDSADQQMAKMVGSPSARTGIWALLEAEGETGVGPDILICPGFTSQRPGNAANPVATAMDAISERLITAMGVCQAPMSTKEDAAAWAADFTATHNIIACAQGARVSVAGQPVVRDASASIAALMVATDKLRGGPYYSPGNRAFRGILGPSRNVGYRLSDPDCEGNYLLQRGVNCIVQLEKSRTARAASGPQGKTFWGFFNTCTDARWRAINVVRTRKAVREVVPRTLAANMGRNLGTHLVVTITQALEKFLSELKSLPEPAILGGEVRFDPKLNPDGLFAAGGFAISMDFQEAPPLTDLQVYMGSYPRSFAILRAEIEAAMKQYNVTGSLAA